MTDSSDENEPENLPAHPVYGSWEPIAGMDKR
jgi:hypothetical protein